MSGALADQLDAACRSFAAREAVRDWHETLRYAALSNWAQRVADALLAQGAVPDEPVIVVVGNRAADFAALLGIWRAACVAIPSHGRHPPRCWARRSSAPARGLWLTRTWFVAWSARRRLRDLIVTGALQ